MGVTMVRDNPLTEEITLKIFGSQDLSGFPRDLLSDEDSVDSTEKVFGILETPVETWVICMRTPGKTDLIFWQSCLFQSDLLRSWSDTILSDSND